ncbi:PP2C family protein-serine/threonine phosphatase [Streptomyces sp. NBC_00388]|uniref:PP2C family protein-serine/threonine phosphatase n=1 Tax=Streptomyces sp. NBC_00388 TaxID=2975735 RepID=UPI002E1F27E5
MDSFTAVERALRTAAPHLLVEVVTEALREHCDAVGVELRMADYAVTTLQLVEAVPLTTEPVSVNDSPQGRAFGAQEPCVVRAPGDGPVVVHLPVTVRGDRMGTLSVTIPADRYGDAVLPGLVHVCEALGHEILVAERDTDVYLIARRAARLTLAAEIQWQLLPGRSLDRPEFSLGAHLEPAYAIFGDSYDWTVSAGTLTLAVMNGMGSGIDAALLTSLATNALRNARRAGVGLADQAYLADQAVYAQYRGEAHVALLLMSFDLATGAVAVVDAGSPRLWRMRGRTVERVGFDAQLPLGMFEDTNYTTEDFHVLPGDRLLFGSDGVYDTRAVGGGGEVYGDRGLARSVGSTRFLPPSQVPRALLRELATYRGDVPLADDALVVCVDWAGRG